MPLKPSSLDTDAAPRRPTHERDRLISEHVEVAGRIAARIARRCPPSIARDDLQAAALLGLTEAAERYDLHRDEPFLGYATKRIRGAVLDELRRGDIMPRRMRSTARKIGATIQRLERELGAPPSDEAIAEALGVSLEEYKSELEELVHVAVGAFDVGEGGDPFERTPSRDASPEHEATRRESIRRVREALPKLDPRDLLVLSLYYNDELTYPEIGQVLEVTTSRVCQLHGRAIARLRTALDAGAEAAWSGGHETGSPLVRPARRRIQRDSYP